MPELKLIIGDKNLSSWSLRAWLGIKLSGLPFQEILVPLDQPATKADLRQHSPSDKVPCLHDGDLRIWDSLAICEYLAEIAPQKDLWPKDPKRRALARSMVAEMHSGFDSLRNQLSMDIRLRMEVRHLVPGTLRDIERVLFLWNQALESSRGPFLFEKISLADAFFAPVVFRFQSYGIKTTSKAAQSYMSAILEHEFLREWVGAAMKETPPPVVFN